MASKQMNNSMISPFNFWYKNYERNGAMRSSLNSPGKLLLGNFNSEFTKMQQEMDKSSRRIRLGMKFGFGMFILILGLIVVGIVTNIAYINSDKPKQQALEYADKAGKKVTGVVCNLVVSNVRCDLFIKGEEKALKLRCSPIGGCTQAPDMEIYNQVTTTGTTNP